VVTPGELNRRRFLKLMAGASALAIGADSLFWEPYRPELTHLEIRLANLPDAFDGFTILQLSDFHYDPYAGAAQIEAGIELAGKLSVDLIALTGDFVTQPLVATRASRRRAAEHAIPCSQMLARLRSQMGSYAVLGNHDAGSDPGIVTEALRQNGIMVLENRAVPIERAGARIWLAGVGDAMERKSDLEKALQGVDKQDPVILLAHEPDFADRATQRGVHLQLSGHSHGGQVRLPFMGALFLPPLARKYPWGLRQVGGLALYTNVGIGTIHVPVRWNCPPEVTLVTLRRGRAEVQ
jgi:predicted MPP superfamily phosphohydrolase